MGSMPPAPARDADLQLHREAIRRGLLRVNTAAILLLSVIVAFALGAMVQAYRAQKSAEAAQTELRKSYFAQAQATRVSAKVGQRHQSLQALTAAARIQPGPDPRNEAIASLALIDLEEIAWQPMPIRAPVAVDPTLKYYATTEHAGAI